MAFDLEDDQPVAMVPAETCEDFVPFFERFKLVLPPGSTEVLSIRTMQEHCHCLSRLRIDYWHGGEWATATMPAENGDPLEAMDYSPNGYDVIYVGNPTGDDAVSLTYTRYDCAQVPEKCTELLPPR